MSKRKLHPVAAATIVGLDRSRWLLIGLAVVWGCIAVAPSKGYRHIRNRRAAA